MKIMLATVHNVYDPSNIVGWYSFPNKWLLRHGFILANKNWQICAAYKADGVIWTVYVKEADTNI